jgi:ATP-dependent DNA helicase DinG
MQAVADKLEKMYGNKLQIQGQSSRQVIIEQHKKAIDQGKMSIIFGTQSFSEGLDLPGDYLTNVIITKIPFAVPTSPVEEAHAEYIKAKGGNPFMELSIPQASKKLVQAAGRLLRNEADSGRVVILDRRLVSKRYGKSMLDSLPPFKKYIEY